MVLTQRGMQRERSSQNPFDGSINVADVVDRDWENFHALSQPLPPNDEQLPTNVVPPPTCYYGYTVFWQKSLTVMSNNRVIGPELGVSEGHSLFHVDDVT
jgi:hypothetical protein